MRFVMDLCVHLDKGYSMADFAAGFGTHKEAKNE
jgi:hypothetical protein